MAPKPTKREEKQRARAKKDITPYYKKTWDFERACPFCDTLLRPIYSGIGQFSCECGVWHAAFSMFIDDVDTWSYLKASPGSRVQDGR